MLNLPTNLYLWVISVNNVKFTCEFRFVVISVGNARFIYKFKFVDKNL